MEPKKPTTLSTGFNIPSKLIIDFYVKSALDFRKLKRQNGSYKKAKDVVGAKERDYIEKYTENIQKTNPCRLIKGLNPKNIQIMLDVDKKYYDQELLRIVSCIAGISMWTYLPYSKKKYNYNIPLFWDDLRIFGEKKGGKGEFGDVYESTSITIKNGFIIKHSRQRSDGKIELDHEIFVSFILNRYRVKIPNFMYGYGYFVCSEPIETEKYDIFSVCDFSGNDRFAIFERINGYSMTQYLYNRGKPELNEYLNLFLQI